MATISITAEIPLALGTLVYRTSDLDVLWEHPNSYEELRKYEVAGYELSFIKDSEGNLTSEVGNAILAVVSVGGDAVPALTYKEYLRDTLVTESTPTLEERINNIKRP